MRISDWSSDVCSSDLLDRLQHALAAIALLVAVAQLDRLVGAGRGAGGHGGAAEGAALQSDVDLDGRIAPGVQDLPGLNIDDCSHGPLGVLGVSTAPDLLHQFGAGGRA